MRGLLIILQLLKQKLIVVTTQYLFSKITLQFHSFNSCLDISVDDVRIYVTQLGYFEQRIILKNDMS